MCSILFEVQYNLLLLVSLFNLNSLWDICILDGWIWLYSSNSDLIRGLINSLVTPLSIETPLKSLWNLNSTSFATALHDVTPSWPLTYKLTTALAFLIAIRGCLPRYRYDFLTKLGWVKFLGQTLTFFLTTATIVAVS